MDQILNPLESVKPVRADLMRWDLEIGGSPIGMPPCRVVQQMCLSQGWVVLGWFALKSRLLILAIKLLSWAAINALGWSEPGTPVCGRDRQAMADPVSSAVLYPPESCACRAALHSCTTPDERDIVSR